MKSIAIGPLRLQGDIPAFGSTVQHLLLYENMMKRLRHSCYKNDSYVLLQHNRLSCHLPLTNCNNGSPHITLCGAGNHLQGPSPPWVSDIERNGLFWSSGKEGQVLLVRVIFAILVFVVALLLRYGWKTIVFAISRLQQDLGRLSLLNYCTSQLPYLACRTVLCVALLMMLLDWTYYDCPRTLTLASTCHKDSTRMHLAVVLLWYQLPSRWRLSSLTRRTLPNTSTKTPRRPPARLWRSGAMWVVVVWPLSSLAMLNMASQCVPGFLRVEGRWFKLLYMGIGACQSFISAIVIPYLAEKLTPNR